ncbi:hypothetical protein HHI36_004163 [Cryptolaemus montrouzieri]|uniref:Uncharacterized protein n=1 Tax=Cryptolaemus montrouzieri TaxID=559131 RepID=A0ABD2NQE4_9CUCU
MYEVDSNYIEEVSILYGRILDIHFGRRHIFELLSAAKVTAIIEEAQLKLPSSLRILQTPIMKTPVQHISNEILMKVHFSVSEFTSFDLIKVTPIPLKITKTSYWISKEPRTVLAVDYNTQIYFELTDDELKSSIPLTANAFLCSPMVVKNIDSNPNCIIDHLHNRLDRFKCHIEEKTSTGIIWKELYMANSWLYITDHTTSIAVICQGNRTELTIQESGIIQKSQDCIIKTRSLTLTPKLLYKSIPVLSSS